MSRFVYSFGEGRADGDRDMRDLLGGKGAGLAEMTRAGVPVPPGYTITTDVCRHHMQSDGRLPEGFADEERQGLSQLEKRVGKVLGDPDDPLLVSVRSGAKFSMPGMMDTVLNLGLNERSVEGLAQKTQNPCFALDSYRRLIQMFSDVVLGVSRELFEAELHSVKEARQVQLDNELDEAALREVIERYLKLCERETGAPFPQDPHVQLEKARDAVFESWSNQRAKTYRRLHNISDDLGTAVNVQAMVFGNMGAESATGVGFTRNPSTGRREFYGEFLPNAQGEDVVAGTRTPLAISSLGDQMPAVAKELQEITTRLEQHYREMQDFEFTVQGGKLYLLQTRTGKRSAQAAVQIAVDMVTEGLISREEALLRVDPQDLEQLLHPSIDPEAKVEVIATGIGASPGAAAGELVFLADDAVTAAEHGKAVILVRKETLPDDVHGMHASKGILTATGGETSHAAVVARGMGKACIVGCKALRVDERGGTVEVDGRVLRRGDVLTIDGSSGRVILGKAPTVDAGLTDAFRTFLEWADQVREIGVRTNADQPSDSAVARDFGAEGIGLCRTEHMFFAEDRLPIMQDVVLSAAEAKRAEREIALARAALDKARSESDKEALRQALSAAEDRGRAPIERYQGSILKLEPFQKEDFKGILRAMQGLPVTIRTLDPPMHEFLPKHDELAVEIARLEERGADAKVLDEKRGLLRRVEDLNEFNPMLGHRGCRLGISYPELTAMQVRAIFEAACELAKEGVKTLPEVMIPLVGHVNELKAQAEIARRVAEEVIAKHGVKVEYLVGTMIEVPRAALTAEQVGEVAEFFSFGTNDLTQMTFGYSRDDTYKFLPEYVEAGILEADPFVTIDEAGVGQLVEMATLAGRRARPGLKVGICGEHGGDPATVHFCARIGLDYVSCSPFRVPIARLAAAQAALGSPLGEPVGAA